MTEPDASVEPGLPEAQATPDIGLDIESAATCVESDQRLGRRIPSPITARILRLDGTELFSCEADEVGEGGLHLRAPVGFGLAVGQRYEIIFEDKLGLPEFANVTGERRYATIIRTEMHLGTAPHEVGVGLRFDHRLFL